MFFTIGELMKELAKHDPATEIKVLSTHEDYETNTEVGFVKNIIEIEEYEYAGEKRLLIHLYD